MVTVGWMLLALLVGPGWASGDEPPDQAIAWASVFDQTLPQYKSVNQQYAAPASVAPGCLLTEGCEALALEQWSLLVALEPWDQRRFSPARIRIHPLGERSAEQWLAALETLGAAPGRLSIAGLAVGPYWVELAIPCTVGTLLPYEAHDLAQHIQARLPELTLHSELAWSPCAQKRFERRTLSWLAAEASLEREQWGIVLPQGRIVLELPD